MMGMMWVMDWKGNLMGEWEIRLQEVSIIAVNNSSPWYDHYNLYTDCICHILTLAFIVT